MNKHLALLATALMFQSVAAEQIEIRAAGGHFKGCELVDIGKKGAIEGQFSLHDVEPGGKWASAVGLQLIDEKKFQTSWKVSLTNAAHADLLEARMEFFLSSRPAASELIGRFQIANPTAFKLAWNESGLVSISIGGAPTRLFAFDFKPTKALFMTSGGRGKLDIQGAKRINCPPDSPSAPG